MGRFVQRLSPDMASRAFEAVAEFVNFIQFGSLSGCLLLVAQLDRTLVEPRQHQNAEAWDFRKVMQLTSAVPT